MEQHRDVGEIPMFLVLPKEDIELLQGARGDELRRITNALFDIVKRIVHSDLSLGEPVQKSIEDDYRNLFDELAVFYRKSGIPEDKIKERLDLCSDALNKAAADAQELYQELLDDPPPTTLATSDKFSPQHYFFGKN